MPLLKHNISLVPTSAKEVQIRIKTTYQMITDIYEPYVWCDTPPHNLAVTPQVQTKVCENQMTSHLMGIFDAIKSSIDKYQSIWFILKMKQVDISSAACYEHQLSRFNK